MERHMSQTVSRGEQARAEILEAAKALFLANGYHGTSMRAIAEASGGRAVAGLYNHFPTKEAIFRALIEERNPYGVLVGTVSSAVDGAATVAEFVDGVLRAVFDIMPRHYDFLQLAQIDIREFEGRNVTRVFEQVFPSLVMLIRRAQALPGGRPVPDMALARLLASVTLGFVLTEQLVPHTVLNALSRKEWADLFIDVVLHGLARDDAAGEGMES